MKVSISMEYLSLRDIEVEPSISKGNEYVSIIFDDGPPTHLLEIVVTTGDLKKTIKALKETVRELEKYLED